MTHTRERFYIILATLFVVSGILNWALLTDRLAKPEWVIARDEVSQLDKWQKASK